MVDLGVHARRHAQEDEARHEVDDALRLARAVAAHDRQHDAERRTIARCALLVRVAGGVGRKRARAKPRPVSR